MGAKSETVIKKDTQILGGAGARDVISTNLYSGHIMFITKFRTKEQKLCLAVIQLKLIEGHPKSPALQAFEEHTQPQIHRMLDTAASHQHRGGSLHCESG